MSAEHGHIIMKNWNNDFCSCASLCQRLGCEQQRFHKLLHKLYKISFLMWWFYVIIGMSINLLIAIRNEVAMSFTAAWYSLKG